MEEVQNIANEGIERDVEKRSNGSQVFTEKYSEEAVDRLKNLVLTFANQGEDKYYMILVDGEIVVAKNCDGHNFDKYLQFVTKHTQSVEVRMFQGLSPNCNKYKFQMNKGLSGANQNVDVQAEIDKALEEQRLQTELKTLKEKLDKKERKIQKLKAKLEEKETGMEQFVELVKNGTQLAGAFGINPNKGLSGTPEPESEVDVEIEEENQEPSVSENQQVFNDLLNTFGEDGIKNALGWITILSTNPKLQEKMKEEINKLNNQEDGEV